MPTRREAGFALIMALLTLMVLTFLGLTLATTTTTELQIGYNYKWSQQAFYSAETGLELAKRFLRQQTWSVLLPSYRDYTQMGSLPTWTLARPDTAGNPSRNWENSDCDRTLANQQGVGFGIVLDHTNLTFPFQNVSNFLGQNLSGAFTVWVRRPVIANPDGTESDEKSDARMIITAEGVAPFTAVAASTSYGQRNKAVRYLELELKKEDPGDCENDFIGQTGQGALGANYDPCKAIEASGVAIPGATGAGVTEVNPN